MVHAVLFTILRLGLFSLGRLPSSSFKIYRGNKNGILKTGPTSVLRKGVRRHLPIFVTREPTHIRFLNRYIYFLFVNWYFWKIIVLVIRYEIDVDRPVSASLRV